MRTIICLTILFTSHIVLGQNRYTDHFKVSTDFELGETHTYEVSEFFKIDHILFGIRSTVFSTVSFKVIDTADGGHWLKYSIKIDKVKQNNDSTAYILAALADGLQLLVFAKDGQIVPDSILYHKTKEKILTKLDFITNSQTFGKKMIVYINFLRAELNENAGLGSLLRPLMLFKVYHDSKAYKKFRTNERSGAANILNEKLFSGAAGNKWESSNKDSTVSLNILFVADPVPAARFYKPIYESLLAANNIRKGKNFYPPEMRYIIDYNFKTQPGKTFPVSLQQKVVSEYLFRSVNRVEMKEVSAFLN